MENCALKKESCMHPHRCAIALHVFYGVSLINQKFLHVLFNYPCIEKKNRDSINEACLHTRTAGKKYSTYTYIPAGKI